MNIYFGLITTAILLGQSFPEEAVDKRSSAFAAAILSAAIEDGASIKAADKAASEDSGYRVMVHLVIENFGVWPLVNPRTFANSGEVSYPASAVLPGHRESMVMHKTGWIIKGSYGTVSWELEGGKRVIVMWFAPFSFDFYSNKLAVGLVDKDVHDKSWADMMYHNSGNFTTAPFSNFAHPIEYCDQIFCVLGTMGTSHHPRVKIAVYPRDRNYFAYNVQKYISDREIDTVVG